MKLGISCAHPDDIEVAEDILTQFGKATGCVVVADGYGAGIIGDVIADEVSVKSVKGAVAAVNAQVKDSRTFRVFTPVQYSEDTTKHSALCTPYLVPDCRNGDHYKSSVDIYGGSRALEDNAKHFFQKGIRFLPE